MITPPRTIDRSTAGPAQRAAIERGEAAVREWVQLLETGTDEQIEAEICWRGAMITADILVFRAIRKAQGWHELARWEIEMLGEAPR